MTYPIGRNLRDIKAPLESHARQDAEFVAGILTVDVEGGIGLGKSGFLRFRQSFGKLYAAVLHLGEDVVGGAIQNSVHRSEAVPGGGLVNHAQDRNSTS